MKNALIQSDNGNLAFKFPYDETMLAEFKGRVPPHDRRWDGSRKVWLVAAGHLAALEHLCDRYNVPVVKQLATLYDAPRTVQKIKRVEYIGAPKEREDGSFTAMGYADGGWSVVFPQDVLRGWFELADQAPAAPTAVLTYYGALGVKRDATADDLKKAYRGMARRWHPDVNHDPDATEMFQRIGAAYEILSDPLKRRRYDAGLALEASLARGERQTRLMLADPSAFWRPPVRCGWLLVEGVERLGRLVVGKIHQWQPIVDARGRELVTSWPRGADTWTESWI